MSVAIKLSDDIVRNVKAYATMCHRSVPKQIEFWIKVGKAAEENPDLPYNFIKGTLMALEEVKRGEFEEYNPDSL
jgi:hypothetical protein